MKFAALFLTVAVISSASVISAGEVSAEGPLNPAMRPYHCPENGKGCSLRKRSADALANAVADAVANPNPEANAWHFWKNYCHLIGQGCSTKVKRAVDAINEALVEQDDTDAEEDNN